MKNKFDVNIIDYLKSSVTGEIKIYDLQGNLQHKQDMHTINQNFLFTLYNICFRNGPGLISALGITSSDNTPADSY